MTVVLLALCAIVTSSLQEDSKQLLPFLAATQKQTGMAYDKLSFEADVVSKSYVDKLGKALSTKSHYRIVRRSETILLTSEMYTTIKVDENPAGGGGSTYEVSNVPQVKRVLKTPEFIVVWSNFGDPSVMVYLAQDWQSDLSKYEINFDFSYKTVSLNSRCLGYSFPFYSLYERSGTTKWNVLEFEEGGGMKVEREFPTSDSGYRIDLTFCFESTDGIVRNVEFKPGSDTALGVASVEYNTIAIATGELRVPSMYRYALSGVKPELEESIEINYKSFADESSMPPLTLTDLGVPVGVGLERAFPDRHVERSVWDGKNFNFEKGKN